MRKQSFDRKVCYFCVFYIAGSIWVFESCGKFWKVMEIENTILQDLESFGKKRSFKMAMEEFWIFVWKNSKNIQKLI